MGENTWRLPVPGAQGAAGSHTLRANLPLPRVHSDQQGQAPMTSTPATVIRNSPGEVR